MKIITVSTLTLTLLMSYPVLAAEDAHNHEGSGHASEKHDNIEKPDHEDETYGNHEGETHGGHEEEGGVIKLTPAQIKQAGLKTEALEHRPGLQALHAPGTVAFNAYQLADITALVDGAIYARHARLGDEVKKGQRLVTLTSSALAQAEAAYLRAEAEHRKSKLDVDRLEGLVKEKIVSQSRFQQASSIHQAAHANLAAAKASLGSYGLSKRKINNLMHSKQYGQLTLHAPSSGTVMSDDFRIGQHIAAGTRLMLIADESTVWVEVKLSQSQAEAVAIGRLAMISIKGKAQHYPAKVININHQLDAVTRTVGVRLEVQNPEDTLHPGMFVSTEIEAGVGEEALLLPEQAIQRQGSELIVFVEEEPGHFER
ncbi:MAG: efflux RND transporter periplasmic adaptor subunit, partial [Mariprofundaceae bacterium]|nr:efflux RND transporter periplasmic adaptor subunit [Mariprofundaceae bacterium]